MPEKILIVDDEPLFRNSMLRLLRLKHPHVESAATGLEAVEKIRHNNYAAVVLDLVLPDLEGMEIARYIKEKDPHCAVIILTGQSSIVPAKQAVRLGCFDYLTKPCKADQVSRVLASGMENRRLKLEIEAVTLKNKKLAEASWESIAFFTTDEIIEANEQFFTLFDVDEKNLATYKICDFFPELVLLLTPGNQGAGHPASIIRSEAVHPNGTIFPVELRLAPLSKTTQQQWVVVIRDLTLFCQNELARKQLEQKLTNAERMESIGLMAGSVAHDLNNLLSSMIALPELLLLDMPKNAKYRKDINKIKTAGKQAAAVVGDLLTITRGSTSSQEISNLNSIVDEYKKSQEFSHLVTIYPNITIEVDTSSQLSNSRLSSIQVLKSIINLVRNATEAIEGSGAVTVCTSNQRFKTAYRGYETIPQGEYAVLTVADTGVGIEQHHLEYIFTPFYSNKKLGSNKGTGLGLTVILHTMRDHYGYIDIRRTAMGTIFELYFPTVVHQEPVLDKPLDLETLLGQGEKVLIVGDTREQREIISSLLKRLGYQTTTVDSGQKAIEYIKKTPVDLILLDMAISPSINGYQTLEEIRTINPGQKTIITSGHLTHPEKLKTKELGVNRYLAKPITLSRLAKIVQDEIVGNKEIILTSKYSAVQ